MNILLIGPPGSGKGTQGARIAVLLGLEHIAAGDLLRAEIADDTAFGEAVRAHVERGELVPDELVMQLVVPRALAASRSSGYVLDGFPRSVPQAVEARKLAEPAGARPDHVIHLEVPYRVLVRRLLARARVEGRTDDTEQVIRHRLLVFEGATAPLLAYYGGEGLTRRIDATGSPDEITEAILSVTTSAAQ